MGFYCGVGVECIVVFVVGDFYVGGGDDDVGYVVVDYGYCYVIDCIDFVVGG